MVNAADITITGPNRDAFVQGHVYRITWECEGLQTVNVLVSGTNTPMGNKARGEFVLIAAEGVPAQGEGADWEVPWIDSREFAIRLDGYDPSGQRVVQAQRTYRFRPAVLENRLIDGIYLALHRPENQRLYVQKNQKITHVYLSTSSNNYLWSPKSIHPKEPHDHAGVFRVLSKTRSHWSRMFNVEMPFAMRYFGGHFIHATSGNLYPYLGGPASSGCNRLTFRDARELYQMTPIGTRVEIIGPDG